MVCACAACVVSCRGAVNVTDEGLLQVLSALRGDQAWVAGRIGSDHPRWLGLVFHHPVACPARRCAARGQVLPALALALALSRALAHLSRPAPKPA
jgi:hypothetical protein